MSGDIKRDSRRRWRIASALAFGAGAVAGLLVLTAAASAAEQPITFNVADQAGRPQVRVGFYPPGASDEGPYLGFTDQDGAITLGLSPGQTIYYTRQSGEDSAPEGWPGRSYTVPPSPPSEVDLTLPDALSASVPTPTTHDGSWIAGAVNDLRQAHGLPPLHISTTLNAIAADTSPYASDTLAIDSGWPDPFGLKALYSNPFRQLTITDFVDSQAIGRQALDPNNYSIGVARLHDSSYNAPLYVAVFGGQCNEEPRCGMTDETGVAPAYLQARGFGNLSLHARLSVAPTGQLINGKPGPVECPTRGCPILGYDKGSQVTLTANTSSDTRIAFWYVGDSPLPTDKQCIGQIVCTLTLDSDTYVLAYLLPVHKVRGQLRSAKRLGNTVKLVYKLSPRRAQGHLRVRASGGGRLDGKHKRLRCHRHGRRVIVKGRLRQGNWNVNAIFRGRGSWPHHWAVSSVKIHAQGRPSSWTKMRIDRL